MTASVSVAVLGLREAGSLIARDLAAAGADVRGYDPKVDHVPGVAPRISEADAVRDADLVGRDLLIELRDRQAQES